MNRRGPVLWLVLWLAPLLVFGLAARPRQDRVTRAQQVWVSLWPEYDRPAMLVIYRITLPQGTALPAQVSLRIPQRAGQPYAVASAPSINDTLLNAEYSYEPATGSAWAWVHVTTQHPYLQVEYYDPALETDEPQRTYTFEWPGDLAVDEFIVEFLPPWNAQNPKTEPALPQQGAGPGGIPVYQKNFGSLDQGVAFTLTLSYTKDDATLTIEHLQQAAPAQAPGPEGPAVEPPAPGRSWPAWLPWVLVALGSGLVAFGLFHLWRERQARPRAARPASRKPKKKPKAEIRYCPSCGAETLPGARYCHRCGAPLYPS